MPVGTLITDSLTGEVVADLTTDGMEVIIARGGKGGLGNIHFKARSTARRASLPTASRASSAS